MDQSGSTNDPGTPSGSGWAAPPPPVHAGPEGFVYADVPNRAIAYIIDVIILGIVNFIAFAVLAGVGLSIVSGLTYNYFAGLVLAIVSLVVSGAYFIYTWTSMRGTVGMKALGMQIGNANDGKTLTMDQAIRRWIALGAPFGIAQAFNPLPGIGILLGLAAFAWFIFLLWTTYSSPTKQGFHDKFVNSMVVKATRVAG
jgi:RDD family.